MERQEKHLLRSIGREAKPVRKDPYDQPPVVSKHGWQVFWISINTLCALVLTVIWIMSFASKMYNDIRWRGIVDTPIVTLSDGDLPPVFTTVYHLVPPAVVWYVFVGVRLAFTWLAVTIMPIVRMCDDRREYQQVGKEEAEITPDILMYGLRPPVVAFVFVTATVFELLLLFGLHYNWAPGALITFSTIQTLCTLWMLFATFLSKWLLGVRESMEQYYTLNVMLALWFPWNFLWWCDNIARNLDSSYAQQIDVAYPAMIGTLGLFMALIFAYPMTIPMAQIPIIVYAGGLLLNIENFENVTPSARNLFIVCITVAGLAAVLMFITAVVVFTQLRHYTEKVPEYANPPPRQTNTQLAIQAISAMRKLE